MPAISPTPLLFYYIIYTTDTALAAAWLAANPTGVVTAGPATLAASQGLTVNYTPTVLPDPSGCWFQYFSDGSNPHIDLIPTNVDGGIIDPNTLYGIPSPPNTNWDPIAWKWQGSIFPYYVTAPVGSTTLQLRSWACGFELGAAGNANLATPHGACGPAASRTTDGYGFAVSKGGAAADISQGTTAPTGSGTLPNGTWERFYLRPWLRPNQGEVAIWSTHGSLEGIDAAYVTMDTLGRLVVRNVGNAGTPGTVLGTTGALDLNTWVKIDLLYRWRIPNTPTDDPGAFVLLINGGVNVSVLIPLGSSSGLGASNGRHQSSKVGSAQTFAVGGLTPTVYKYDLDDWICCNNPFAPGSPNSVDFSAGTHIRLVNASGFDAAAGAWTGDFRGMAGNPPGSATQMTANTPNTRLRLPTDFVNLPQLGVASIMVQAFPNTWPPTTPAKVGLRFNGSSELISSATVNGFVGNFCGQLFNFGTSRPDITSLDITIDKDAASSAVNLGGLFGSVEYIGVWGPEDMNPGGTVNRPPVTRTGLHNAPYPEIAAVASPQQQTMAWASARQGTYVGNGVGLDVSVGVPFQWLWIRNLSTNATGYWWSSQCTVHQALSGQSGSGIDVNFPLPFPPSGVATSFRVSGNSANANSNGVTYQWVAFSDPDSRFLLNGAGSWDSSNLSAINPFQDPTFTPVCVFTAQEDIQASIAGFFYKGPGNPTDTANPLTGADVAAVMTFAGGTLTTKPAGHSKAPQMAYGAWRAADGTGAAGVIDCVTYTGNGVSSRNIAVNLNGTSPLFAFGIAHTLPSYFRDPSHTGLDSSQIGAGVVTTAIIGGGLNYVTVGALLNVSGRVYDLFVIAGSAYGGTWTPSVDPGTGVPPVPTGVPPVVPAEGPPPSGGPPPVVVPVHGWYLSDAGYRGNVSAIGDSHPANPRAWNDVVGFATGAAGMLGGSPGSATVFHNRLIYAASGYVVGTDAPPLRIFDGLYDRELVRMPPSSAGVVRAIVSLLTANGTVYVSTWDAGTTPATWTGRIFALDINAAALTPIGDAFPAGHLPYALAFHNSALWCGSHRGDASAGKVFTLRPDLDTTWTVDRDLATDSMAGVAALASLQGTLYVGATAAAGTFAKLLARASAGTYSTAFTGTGGAATTLNGFLALTLFKNKLYASFWNADTPAIAAIYTSVDGVTWTVAYTGAAATLRPFIGLLVDAGTLYAIGGGLGLAAAIVATDDGTTWTNLTPQLPETDKTLTPAFGVVVR